jgi:hypothetical protein
MPLRARFPRIATAGLVLALGGAGAACGGPFLMLPGGVLRGEVVETPVTDWSFVDASHIALEVRPTDPYSVNVGYVVRGGRLYVDPAEGRRWLACIRDDPRVRVRVDGRVYAARATLVTDEAERAGFEQDRFVYRLDGTAPWNPPDR